MTYHEELALELNNKLPKEYTMEFETGKVFIRMPDNHSFDNQCKELHKTIDNFLLREVKSKPNPVTIIITNYSKSKSWFYEL
jgi:hypothetical protein